MLHLKAMTLLLAGVTTIAASPRVHMGEVPNHAGFDYRPEYRAMRSPAGHAASPPPELPGFPADRVKRRELGLAKRQSSDDLDLVAAQSWYWGDDSAATAPDSSGNPIVNITGPDRVQLRGLNFFNSTQEKWGWMNSGNRSLIIVLESGTCGNEKRQPYLAENVVYFPSTRKATFTAAVTNWEASCPGYQVVADSQGLVLPTESDEASLTRRQSVDAGIDIARDFSGNIFSTPDALNSSLQFNLDCKACSTSGRLNFRFEASLDPLNFFSGEDVLTASAEVRPTGVGANIEFGFRLGGELTEALSFNPSLPPFALPGGVSAEPFVIGPNLVVGYLAELSSVSAEAELSIGTRITINDAAVARAAVGDGDNTFEGWTPSFEMIGPELSASVSVAATTGPQISVELDITVFDNGLTAGLLLAAPQLTASLSANAFICDSNTAGGVCDNPNAALGATIDIGLSAEFNAFGGFTNPDDKFPNQFNLFSTSTALFSTLRPDLPKSPS